MFTYEEHAFAAQLALAAITGDAQAARHEKVNLRDGTCWCGGNNHVQHASTARLRRIASKLGSSYPEDGDKVAQPGDIAPLEQCTGEVSRDQFVPVSPAIAWLALAKIKSARRFL